MQLGRAEAEAIARSGMAALQAGRAAEARAAFQKVVDGGHRSAALWLLLAQACRLGGDEAAEARAVEQVLALEPRNLRALLMKGDAFGRAGDTRAATSFYQAALQAAAKAGPLPPGLQADLERAEALTRQAGSGYVAHLEAALARAGFGEESRGERLQEAVDILFQKKQVYFQQPSAFYFPRLPQIQFYDREAFAWAGAVEAATSAIRSELLAVLADEGAFSPYVEADADRPHQDFHGMLGDPSWSAFYLWKDGDRVGDNAARCPKTLAALEAAPITRIRTRCPSILFSLLRPGAHIPPHNGMLNTRLICHLPLIVPPGCWLRVGNERRAWEEGRLLIFDDSFEHEAMNGSDQPRVILLFDVWRPELSEEERRGVTAIFEAIDSFGAGPG